MAKDVTKNGTPVEANKEELTAEQLKAMLDEQSKLNAMLMEQLDKAKQSEQTDKSNSTETDPKNESGTSAKSKFLGLFSKKEKPEYQKMSDEQWFNETHPTLTPKEIKDETARRTRKKVLKFVGILGLGGLGVKVGYDLAKKDDENEQCMLTDTGYDNTYETYESPNVVDVETVADEI